MACFHPAKAWPGGPGRPWVFSPGKSYKGAQHILIPCGQCVGCRMAKSQDWATRIAHEASLHDANSFVTLTYEDEHYPDHGSVSVRAMQLFMKRLRKAYGSRIRFFLCGEYGEQSWRAHYHLILFGVDFASDRTVWRVTPSGHTLYRSKSLEALWPYGFSEIGTVTAQSGRYVAKYVTKKINGDRAAAHYSRVHPLTGELLQLTPEFALMSRRPGIGSQWFDKFRCDAFPSDFLIMDGSKVPVPAFYTRRLRDLDKLVVKHKRSSRAARHADNQTPERLATREEAQHLRLSKFAREPK